MTALAIFNIVLLVAALAVLYLSYRLNRATGKMLDKNKAILVKMEGQGDLMDARTERLRRMVAGFIEGPS